MFVNCETALVVLLYVVFAAADDCHRLICNDSICMGLSHNILLHCILFALKLRNLLSSSYTSCFFFTKKMRELNFGFAHRRAEDNPLPAVSAERILISV